VKSEASGYFINVHYSCESQKDLKPIFTCAVVSAAVFWVRRTFLDQLRYLLAKVQAEYIRGPINFGSASPFSISFEIHIFDKLLLVRNWFVILNMYFGRFAFLLHLVFRVEFIFMRL